MPSCATSCHARLCVGHCDSALLVVLVILPDPGACLVVGALCLFVERPIPTRSGSRHGRGSSWKRATGRPSLSASSKINPWRRFVIVVVVAAVVVAVVVALVRSCRRQCCCCCHHFRAFVTTCAALQQISREGPYSVCAKESLVGGGLKERRKAVFTRCGICGRGEAGGVPDTKTGQRELML